MGRLLDRRDAPRRWHEALTRLGALQFAGLVRGRNGIPQSVVRALATTGGRELLAFERGPDERKQRGARCCFQLAAHEQVFLDIAWSTFNDISRRRPVRLAVVILVDRRAPCGIRH